MRLPLGIDLFERVRESGCYYVDKTGFIKELLEESFTVNLITRPRRFGKTLTMTMLAEFFDLQRNSKELFEGLEIAKEKELCEKWQNQWPVLFFTLKDIEGDTFQDAYEALEFVIAGLCMKHSYLEESEKVKGSDREQFMQLMHRRARKAEVKHALETLLRMMAAHYGKPVILLVDEYDVPLAKASDNGYYEEMLNVMRAFLGIVWKTNPSLQFAVVTGCLRIAKESIFTGANNFIIRSISQERYSRFFGFTEEEVERMLTEAGIPDCLPEVKRWYDGYLFGSREIYCPWDVINYVSERIGNPKARPDSYWKSTSHNAIIRRFIDIKGGKVRRKFEKLLAGDVIWEHIAEDLTYELDTSSEENLWSILYLAGYLTTALPDEVWNKAGKPNEIALPHRVAALEEMTEPDGKTPLRIPNEEIKTIFAETVAKWFTDTVAKKDLSELFLAWWKGDAARLAKELSAILLATISYYDYKEDYYHAFLTGIFAGAGYVVSSNTERGLGRADIVVEDPENLRAMVIEVKHSKSEKEMEADCAAALAQIDREEYAKGSLDGYETILIYGAAFFKKKCQVKAVFYRKETLL